MTKKLFDTIKRDLKEYGTGEEYQETNKYNITFTVYVGHAYIHVVTDDNNEKIRMIYNMPIREFLRSTYNEFCRYENMAFEYKEWEKWEVE